MSAWQKHGFGPYFALTEANDITMQKGQIRVQTENIFPIIKKFLYSDHEIFVRELVSNAVDAAQKLKTLSSKGEVKGELGDLRVDVIVADLPELIQSSKMPIYGAVLEGKSIQSKTLAKEGILVIGNESKGIRPPILSLITDPITIPKYGNAESLNAAVATGIILANWQH